MHDDEPIPRTDVPAADNTVLSPTCLALHGLGGGPYEIGPLIDALEADGLTVDLRFDLLVPSGKISAVGQILDSHITREPLTGAPVVVWTQNGQLVATATANAYGEFQLEFEAQDDLRLTARVGDRRVRMPLVNLK